MAGVFLYTEQFSQAEGANMVEIELQVELDLDRILFSWAQILRFKDKEKDERPRNEILTPRQFKKYAKQHMHQFCQMGSSEYGLQSPQVLFSTIKAKKQMAYWVTFEHLENTPPFVDYGGCKVWQYGIFRIAIWRLLGPRRNEPVMRWEWVHRLHRDRLSAVKVFMRGGRIFPGYVNPNAPALPF